MNSFRALRFVFLAFSLGLLLVPGHVASALERTRAVRVKELTDDSFEHDTQAATGQTTGRWLVVFVGDELDRSELEKTPPDGDISTADGDGTVAEGDRRPATGSALSSAALIHRVMLVASRQVPREFVPALVHVEKNPALKKRFSIHSTPAVKLFRDRKMYSFSGVPRSTEELQHFLEVGYAGLPAEDVPPELLFWERLVEDLPNKYQLFKKRAEELPWLLPVVGLAVFVVCYSVAAQLLGLGKKKQQRVRTASTKPKASAAGAVKKD